jgi:hypothetical protein
MIDGSLALRLITGLTAHLVKSGLCVFLFNSTRAHPARYHSRNVQIPNASNSSHTRRNSNWNSNRRIPAFEADWPVPLESPDMLVILVSNLAFQSKSARAITFMLEKYAHSRFDKVFQFARSYEPWRADHEDERSICGCLIVDESQTSTSIRQWMQG